MRPPTGRVRPCYYGNCHLGLDLGKHGGNAGSTWHSRLAIMRFVRTTESKVATAARIGPG